MELNLKLKELREENGYTQEFVANYLHIKQNTYSQYETNKRQISLENLVALKNLYGTTIDYILGLE